MPKKRKNCKRDDYSDNDIIDALESCNYAIPAAAKKLGVGNATLYKWIQASPNIKAHQQFKLGMDAVKAREVLNQILDEHHGDAKKLREIIAVCKILLDKAEADKQDVEIKETHKLDKELEEKLNELLGLEE